MKKILLLGGSAQQVIAIETAKRLGYYTVLCDFLEDNPGQFVSDKFYLISTTDKDAILKVAQQECVDGILAYASDPAAPTAAYVSEKLGLASNSFESVDTLCNKDKFRSFLQSNGFNSPRSGSYNSIEMAYKDVERFRFPIIIKPVDSSGSKGVTVLDASGNLGEALEYAFLYSRSHRVIIEEFIEKKHKYLVGGDVFVNDGKIVLWGLLNCHRDNKVNPLVPVGKSYPVALNDVDINNVKKVLQSIVEKLNICSGAMNVELIVDSNGEVWPIDMGPRNGGNMIPDLLGLIFDIDIVEWSVKTAMGETISEDINVQKLYFATHNLHSKSNGIFQDIIFNEELEKNIIRKSIYKKKGDYIEYFDNASKTLGIIFMKFKNEEEMWYHLENIEDKISILML